VYNKAEVDDNILNSVNDLEDILWDEIATKANQATTYTKTEVDTALNTKASASAVEFIGQNVQWRIEAFEPLSLVPRSNQGNPFSELSIDLDNYATNTALAGKQNTLTAGTVSGGYNILQDGVVRAMKAISPIWLAPDTNHLEIGIDLTNYATNTALATKQNTLTAGTGLVFHEKLLEGTKVKSLVAGDNITMTSTAEFVNISADLTTVNTQLALKQDTVDWLSESVETGKHLLNTGPSGLLIMAGNEPGLEIRGSSAPAPGYLYSHKDMTIEGDLFLTGNVHSLGTISSGNAVATNSIIANGASQVTVNDHLKVTGNTTLDGNLTVGFNLNCGDITATAIYGQAALQIQSNINTAISNYNPFWVSGRVSGSNLSIQKSNGKYGFTVSRPAGAEFATGVYKITFNTPAPDANYVISLAQIGSGNIKVWDYNSAFDGRPATTHFHVVTYNTSWALTNWNFYFSIFV
jgi:hypothetical protein